MCFHGEIDRASERFVMGRRNGPSIQNSPSPARSASALATAWLAFDEVDAICPAPRWERPRAVLVGAAVVVVRCFSPRRSGFGRALKHRASPGFGVWVVGLHATLRASSQPTTGAEFGHPPGASCSCAAGRAAARMWRCPSHAARDSLRSSPPSEHNGQRRRS